MDISILPFKSKVLKRAKDAEIYNLYRAALEWDLTEPIVIEDRGDLHSEKRWKDRVEPYHHQVTNLITFCRRLPVTLLSDDVGLGKTISAGLIASELISRGKVSKILIVCPKILRQQWKEELEQKFDISSIIVTGKQLISANPPEEIGAVITTYNTARLYLDKISMDGYEMLILDEAHKLRNLYGTDTTPQVAQKFREALASRLFKYVLMLTATPIQNRLWDLYSLVDLLTVARGHENPFGNQGSFARKFIADGRTNARQLKPEMQDEFRSIVYGYMSRIRRGDAKLHFPERIVQLHRVVPTEKELELIRAIAEPIQELNFFAQIIILQALVSSPEALVKVLEGMALRGTAPKSLVKIVQGIVRDIKVTTKLNGLSTLINNLREKQPNTWRVVVFTRWRETQTTIQLFLESQGISCGLINGDSSIKNQDVITRFKTELPEINVIISTEAGSEGVNLQAANVLVNYDLPWNPMIVEQRIGRIQRLSSNFANVSIFNIVLQGTFEEYIVGRLMEKLQLASQAIGDIEALMEASGIDEGGDNDSSGFEEKIRQLVVASLAGKDVEQATHKAADSITNAKKELEKEEKNINEMLGSMGDALDSSPKCPKLPQSPKSMDPRNFVLNALTYLGSELEEQPNGFYFSKLDGMGEYIRFTNETSFLFGKTTLYSPGSSAFERLVSKMISEGMHMVLDADKHPLVSAEKEAAKWSESFGAKFVSMTLNNVSLCFTGHALIRVRATVAHDSYEKLVDVECDADEHFCFISDKGLEPIGDQIENPTSVGALADKLSEKSFQDVNIIDFCRFYTERRDQEVIYAGNDLRKRKKLEDEFTPRLDSSLVGLSGVTHRKLAVSVIYTLDSKYRYESTLTIIPSSGDIIPPDMEKCMKTERVVPSDCLGKCEITKAMILRHLLSESEISKRLALAEHTVLCALSHKRVLEDEVEKSDVSGNFVIKSFLKTSSLSGKKGEPEFFDKCEFTSEEVLKSELLVSQISGKKFKSDEQLKSSISGKIGHKSEFIFCSETNKPLLLEEAEKCEITGKLVAPGILELCEVTGKKVLPSELERSAASGKKALKKFFVGSSISNARILEQEAIRSVEGRFCAPLEAKTCFWSGKNYHIDDLKSCALTGELFYLQYLTGYRDGYCLESLLKILDGSRRKEDKSDIWAIISTEVLKVADMKNCIVESAELSVDENKLAVCLKIKTWMGLKTRFSGIIFSIKDKAIVGKFIMGKRENGYWNEDVA